MLKDNYIIKRMTRDELDIAIDWAAAEGWNPGLYDRDCFYDTDPNGFFIGLLNNEPIACISAVKYNEHFGFIGFYIVKTEFRGKGYGLRIWREALNYLGNRNIGLDGVLAQQENYKKSGFKLGFRNIRYQGISRGAKVQYRKIVKLSSLPFKQLVGYDNLLFPASRPQFLKGFISQPESLSLGAMENEKLAGYAVIRKCQVGFKIGPLFADNEDIAEKLFQTMNSFVTKDVPIFLDVPEVNSMGITLTKRHSLKMVFETARMYSKLPPSLPLDKIFGVTTLELG